MSHYEPKDEPYLEETLFIHRTPKVDLVARIRIEALIDGRRTS